jgi:deoxyadenosine/deoxycytidine kinase
LKSFKDNYLDFYQIMKKDISKNSKAIAAGNIDDLQVVLSNNASYKSKLLATVDNEIDVKKMLATMIIAVETRVEQMFDQIQERPEEVNSRTERLWLEYFDRLGTMLEKWSKYVVGAPDQVIQHNFTVQHIDQHVQILQEAIRDALTEFDLETSLKFMDRLNISLQKLKDPGMSGAKPTPQGVKISEVKILSEEINRKLNED